MHSVFSKGLSFLFHMILQLRRGISDSQRYSLCQIYNLKDIVGFLASFIFSLQQMFSCHFIREISIENS